MGQMSECSSGCVCDPSRAQGGCLHPIPVRSSCALGAASPRVGKGHDPVPQKEGCGLAALSGSWLPQGETFLRAHTLYGAQTNICSGGGTVAQPGRFVTPPFVIKPVSAGAVGPGTQHLWPGDTGQPWPNRGAALGIAWRHSPGRDGDGDGGSPGSYLSQVPPWVGTGVWPWPLSPPKEPPAGSRGANTALSCVLRLSRALADLGQNPVVG